MIKVLKIPYQHVHQLSKNKPIQQHHLHIQYDYRGQDFEQHIRRHGYYVWPLQLSKKQRSKFFTSTIHTHQTFYIQNSYSTIYIH